MSDVKKSLLINDIELNQIRVSRKNEDVPENLEFNLELDIMPSDNTITVKYFISLVYIFEISLEILASYVLKNIDINDKITISEQIVAKSYSIYAKIILVMSFLMDQLGYLPLILEFNNFNKALERSLEKYKNN